MTFDIKATSRDGVPDDRINPKAQPDWHGKAGRTWLGPLLLMLLDGLGLMELGSELLAGLLAEGLFDEPACIAARRADEAQGLNGRLALGRDDDFDGSRKCGVADYVVMHGFLSVNWGMGVDLNAT
jgi:hypothetical protein